MVGEDLARTLRAEPEGHRYLLPDVCLSGGRFLDGTTPAELPAPGRGGGDRRPGPAAGPAHEGGGMTPAPGDAPDGARRTAAERKPLSPAAVAAAAAEVAPRAGLPLVAIVGRPNVGKSTLVNRIIGRREAIVEERPGVTRDRKEVEADWNGRSFILVDTGGWMVRGSDLDAKVSHQSELAIADADVILLVVDVTTGATEDDDRVARILRGTDAPVLVVANKVDGDSREHLVWDLLRLGLGDPFPVSSLHGRGTGDLLDAVVAALPEEQADPAPAGADTGSSDPDGAVAVAIVGRPNVGKSTLFNRLIGEERAVVHDLAGTTRDSVDTIVETSAGPIRFIDTAGMRRRARTSEGTEYYSLVRALQSVDTADVALLVIDATEGITHQDQRLAERVDAAGCPVVVLLNKWERVDAEARTKVSEDVDPPPGLHRRGPGAAHQRPHRQGRGPAAAHAVGHHRPVPPPGAHPSGQRGHRRGPGRHPGPARGPGALRHPGRDRPAHLHPVHQQGPGPHLPALPRAGPARRLRPPPDGGQDPGPPPQLSARARAAPAAAPGRRARA